MQEGRHGANAITVGTVELLLTCVGGGTAVHLTPCATPGCAARPAVPPDFFAPRAARLRPGLDNYDRSDLMVAKWSGTTLCGRPWVAMVGGEGGSISPRGEGSGPAYVPTCGRCLAVLDGMLPPPVPHPRLPLVARVVADAVTEHGRAEVYGVPGDQQTELRRQVRTLVRKQTGHPCQTLAYESTVFAICDPILESHREQDMASVAEAMNECLLGEVPRPRSDAAWRLFWSTWATD